MRSMLLVPMLALTLLVTGCADYRDAVRAEQCLAAAQQALAARQPAEAQALAIKASRLRPDSPVVQGRVGAMLAAMGLEREALRHFDRALGGRGRLPAAVLAAAIDTYLVVGRERQAAAALLSAVRRYPRDALVLNELGYACADRGALLPQAEQVLAQAVSLAPDNGAILDSLGWAMVKQGKLQPGRALLVRADALMPNNYEIVYHLATVSLLLGDHRQAKRLAGRALALEPEYEPARTLLRSLR